MNIAKYYNKIFKKLTKRQVQALYNLKKGDRVILVYMDDNKAPDFLTKGTITMIDSMLTIHVSWDDGNGLGLIPGLDSFFIMPSIVKDFEKQYNEDTNFRKFMKKYSQENIIRKWLSEQEYIYIGPKFQHVPTSMINIIARTELI